MGDKETLNWVRLSVGIHKANETLCKIFKQRWKSKHGSDWSEDSKGVTDITCIVEYSSGVLLN